jgi:putative ABC transport system permease protein
MKYLHLIWSNLKRRKLRTILTLLSIMVAFILFGYLCAIKKAIVGGVTLEGASRLIVRHKVSIIQLLPQSYETRIERIPGVVAATHLTWFGGIYQDPKNFFPQMPTVPEDFLPLHPEFILTEAEKKAWLATRTGAVVGRKTADRYGFKVGDRVPIRSTIFTKTDGSQLFEFDIVGIYEGKDKNTDTTVMYMRYDYIDEARVAPKGQVGWYVVKVADPERAPEVARKIDEEFANSPAETKTETEGAFIQSFANQVGNMALITAAILSAVFFTIRCAG